MSNYAAALSAYDKFAFADGAWTRDVYRRGRGPAVIVIHEIPGLHPLMVRFADRVAAAGMTVYLPVLFGEPARRAHAECGGKGVGAIGMCFTGGFALAMMTEPAVVAPVLSQPSLPVALGSKQRAADIGASPEEIACVKRRFAEEGLSMIGLRFKSDRSVPDARFATYKREFGASFEAIEVEDADALKGDRPPHAVLTIHMKEEGPTKAAEQRVIAFFKERTGA
jgi:dienelactone hydrolase